MDLPRKHQVSLRGASAREISRDALLEEVSNQRQLRNYARRASSSALFIQKVWRRYSVVKKEAERIREEWESAAVDCSGCATARRISSSLLRPFLFFISCLSVRRRSLSPRDLECIRKCLNVLVLSISSADSRTNFCSLVLGTDEERRAWTCQSRKLVSICSFVLSKCGEPGAASQDVVALTSLSMRFLVVFTDVKGWKCITGGSLNNASAAVKSLVGYMGSFEGGLYAAVRGYVTRLDVHLGEQAKNVAPTDAKFLITASALTLAIRPFRETEVDFVGPGLLDMQSAPAQYCLFLLTIPHLTQRLPAVLLPALKHKSVLLPSFRTLLGLHLAFSLCHMNVFLNYTAAVGSLILNAFSPIDGSVISVTSDELITREDKKILGDSLLKEMQEMNQIKVHHSSESIPSAGWALANVICLAAGSSNDFMMLGSINEALPYTLYVRTVINLTDSLLSRLGEAEVSSGSGDEVFGGDVSSSDLRTSYVHLCWPVCQQWHLVKLMEISKANANSSEGAVLPESNNLRKLELVDVAYFYSNILKIYSVLNPTFGSLPVLNILSFCPGCIKGLWEALEGSLFPGDMSIYTDNHFDSKRSSGNKWDGLAGKKQKQVIKDGSNRLANVLNKITGKPQAGTSCIDLAEGSSSSQISEGSLDIWDIEPLRSGPQKISKDTTCMLHLFCATYSHLLLILDDIEFYEKQVPFTLEQQRRIASALNTFVYNAATNTVGQQSKILIDSAVRCLHLLYERNCRHPFCPPALWLSPARKSRPPIAVAARTQEILLAQMKLNDPLASQSMLSVITATPHVYPFEERVQMFREFINMDKSSRRMAGEATGPGSRIVDIVVRRDHIVEDGFRQLNSLGSRLKSSIHVSFVSQNGLPEAGLDYGGLSKEFLTDISKTAFSPEYGLFVQTSTSERLLMPNPAARYLDNGIQMIEFLGRVVGKALYEGILLDYSFSHVFVQKLLDRYSFLDELSTLDPELYRNLMYVKHYDGDPKDLVLDFTVVDEAFGKRQVVELKPGGKDISVTNENKMQYVHAMADYKLNRQILPFSNAFYRGLADLVSPSWLKLFNASEFNQLLSGGEHDIDVDDLRNNTRYTGGYSEGSRTVKLFWEVISGFEPSERCLLLKFVTSCSRGPLLGFKHLQPSFTIHKVAGDSSLWAAIGGQDVERLPSASTCYNTLKLPTYKRASTLRAKLLYAITSNTGFELS